MQGRMRYTDDATVPAGNEYILPCGAEDAHAFAHPIPARLHADLPPDDRMMLSARINAVVVAALRTPEAHERLIAQGAEVAASSPAEFGAFLRKETVRWRKVLRDANIRATE